MKIVNFEKNCKILHLELKKLSIYCISNLTHGRHLIWMRTFQYFSTLTLLCPVQSCTKKWLLKEVFILFWNKRRNLLKNFIDEVEKWQPSSKEHLNTNLFSADHFFFTKWSSKSNNSSAVIPPIASSTRLRANFVNALSACCSSSWSKILPIAALAKELERSIRPVTLTWR